MTLDSRRAACSSEDDADELRRSILRLRARALRGVARIDEALEAAFARGRCELAPEGAERDEVLHDARTS